jgi:pterin-4a-carbinolamine dehydratase
MNTNFQIRLSFSEDHKKRHAVETLYVTDGGLIEKSFRFHGFTDALVLMCDFAHAYHDHPETILEFRQKMIEKYEANELQYKMKV